MNVIERNVEKISENIDLYRLVELAARNCYRSQDKIKDGSAESLIRGLIASGHTAMLEFADMTFMIICDRSTSHQIVRHRMADYAQESLRYCNYSKDKFDNNISFIVPSNIDDTIFDEWRAVCEVCEAAYFVMLEKGAKPEVARSVLPHCTATHIVVKMNMRSLRNFLSLRLDPHAQEDIRDIAFKILGIIYNEAPVFVEDIMDKYSGEYIRRKFGLRYDEKFIVPESEYDYIYWVARDGFRAMLKNTMKIHAPLSVSDMLIKGTATIEKVTSGASVD